MRDVARHVDEIVGDVMDNLRTGRVKHEDDLTGVLVGSLSTGLKGFKSEGLVWDSAILTHRKSGEEKRFGADLLIHVSLQTNTQTYSKGVLVQAKRIGPNRRMTKKHHDDLRDQCEKMQKISASSFVFAYDESGMRCASASKIGGSVNPTIYNECNWTSFRFFWELFRCPVGDSNITSASVEKLAPANAISITGKGQLRVSVPLLE